MGPCRRTVAPGPATPAPFPSICRTRAREAHARVRLLRDGMLRASAKVCHVPRVHAQLGLSSRSPSLGGYARGEGECRRARPRVRVSAAWSGAGSGYMKYMECAWGGFVRVCWGREVVVYWGSLGFAGVRWLRFGRRYRGRVGARLGFRLGLGPTHTLLLLWSPIGGDE